MSLAANGVKALVEDGATRNFANGLAPGLVGTCVTAASGSQLAGIAANAAVRAIGEVKPEVPATMVILPTVALASGMLVAVAPVALVGYGAYKALEWLFED